QIKYEWTLLHKEACLADYLNTDNLGNIYLINGQQITKLDQAGKEVASYSNAASGAISFADVSDPLKILLFYKAFNKIIFLDKFLAELGSPVNIDDLGITSAGIVCTSSQNCFWVFDSQIQAIVLFDSNLQKKRTGISILNIDVTGGLPVSITEKNNMVYLGMSTSNKIIQFDLSGGFVRSIPGLNPASFQVNGNLVTSFTNGRFTETDLIRHVTSEILLPQVNDKIRDVRFSNRRIVILINNELLIFESPDISKNHPQN
ncbi:MAG: hypothetical protein NTW49_02820, partial [Bacteroidia bacterium]|nr:hypothetical protein [Bacteroidia bacterium]